MKHCTVRSLILILALAFSPRLVHSLPPDVFEDRSTLQTAEWAIVGAGPAGLCVLGVLLDVGVDPSTIIWLDPEFNVGRIGAYYNQVPANSDMKEFVKFLNACACFKECSCPAIDELKQSAANNHHPLLSAIIEPLKCLTQHLCTKVKSVRDSMASINFEHTYWEIGTASGNAIHARNVVLATGSHPKTLDYKTQQVIPLDIALSPENLRELIAPTDTVAVIGDAHSAILLLKFLSEMPVKHIYNFYQKPITYASNLDGWVINGTTGLKGLAAEWARNVLEKNPPANLTRIKSSPALLQDLLPHCNKTIYAIGFERNQLPQIDGTTAITHYNPTNGVIAPRLFGIGIAFPEKRINQFGNEDTRIGLDSFMDYALRIVPHWVHDDLFKRNKLQRIKAQIKQLSEASDLFSIWAL